MGCARDDGDKGTRNTGSPLSTNAPADNGASPRQAPSMSDLVLLFLPLAGMASWPRPRPPRPLPPRNPIRRLPAPHWHAQPTPLRPLPPATRHLRLHPPRQRRPQHLRGHGPRPQLVAADPDFPPPPTLLHHPQHAHRQQLITSSTPTSCAVAGPPSARHRKPSGRTCASISKATARWPTAGSTGSKSTPASSPPSVPWNAGPATTHSKTSDRWNRHGVSAERRVA